DRTYSLQFEVSGADIVYNQFTNFLFTNSEHLYGTDPAHYLSAVMKAGKKLSIKPLQKLEERFNEKIGTFIEEGLATETILFIAAISTILEVLDSDHYQTLIKELSALYFHQCVSSLDLSPRESLDQGINRLAEAANSKISLLQNMVKLRSIASIFDLTDNLSYDKRELLNLKNDIIQKIITGSY
ncbi:MAG: hypothetical protein ACTSQ9_07985, partial [Candidatus Hodarchaeales archaeon]